MRRPGLLAAVSIAAMCSSAVAGVSPLPAGMRVMTAPGFDLHIPQAHWVSEDVAGRSRDGTVRGNFQMTIGTGSNVDRPALLSIFGGEDNTAVIQVSGTAFPFPAGTVQAKAQRLLDELKARQAREEAHPARTTTTSSQFDLTTHDGATCVRWNAVAEDRHVPRHEGEAYTLAIHRLICLHPDFPDYVAHVEFSQRLAPGAAPIVADADGLAAVDSLHFTRWPWHVTRIPVDGAPQMMAEAAGAIWVATITSENTPGMVTRIDSRTNTVSARIPVGRIPIGLTADAGGIWVVNSSDNSVSHIDPRTNAVVGTIKVGRNPSMIVSGAGALWVTNNGDGSLARIDPATGQVTTIPDVGGEPSAIAFAGGLIVVTDYKSTQITRIDPATNAVKDRIDGGHYSNFILVDGANVWVNDQGERAALRIGAGAIEKFAADIGDRPTGIGLWGGKLWVANWGGGTLTVLDPETSQAHGMLMPTGPSPINLTNANGALWVSVVNGHAILRLDPKVQ